MIILRTAVGISLLMGLSLSGCGSSNNDSPLSLCKQGCSKAIDLCLAADAGVSANTVKAGCEAQCTTRYGTGAACPNSAAVIAAIKACDSKTTCTEYQACALGLPACMAATGSGGSSGAGTGGAGAGTGGATTAGTGGATAAGTGGSTTAGTGGAGGTSGSANTCADLSACCNRVANVAVKTACNMQVTTVMAQVASGQITQATADQGCAQALAAGMSVYCP